MDANIEWITVVTKGRKVKVSLDEIHEAYQHSSVTDGMVADVVRV